MVKRILMLLAVALPLLAGAQARIAVFSSQAVFDAMPQKAAAEAQLRATSDRLQQEHKLLQDEFDRKFADYQAIATDASTPATITERRVQELQQADKQMQQFEQQAQAELQRRRDALMTPIRERIDRAVKEVGDEGGYEIILDTAVTPVAYIGLATDDITTEVINRLAK